MCSTGTDQVFVVEFDERTLKERELLLYVVKLQSMAGTGLSSRTLSLAPVSEADRNRERLEVERLTNETNVLGQGSAS